MRKEIAEALVLNMSLDETSFFVPEDTEKTMFSGKFFKSLAQTYIDTRDNSRWIILWIKSIPHDGYEPEEIDFFRI